MANDTGTLATALFATTDDMLKEHLDLAPWRPPAGITPRLSDADDVWVVDSTPVECGRSRETVKRSDLAGWAEYGYCASHSRFFWACADAGPEVSPEVS